MMSWPDTLALLGAALQGVGWAALACVIVPCLILLFPKNTYVNDASSTLVSLIDDVNYYSGQIIKWALPILVLSVAFSVFVLSIFGLSWTKLSESAKYLHATAILLGAGATLLAGQHVRVDVFYTHMSPQSRARVDLWGFYLLLLPVCLIITWNSQSFISFSWLIFEGSAESDGIRGEFLLKTTLSLFPILLLAQGLAIAIRAAKLLCGHNQPERPPTIPIFFTDTDEAQ